MSFVVYRSLKFLGFPRYRVGDDGSVWSCYRNRGWIRVKGRRHPRGHLMVTLVSDKHNSQKYVHRLVLLAFVGPCPKGMEARHFPDSDPSNNQLINLSWDTRSRNIRDREIHGTSNHGTRNGRAKTNESQVRQLRKRFAAGHSVNDLSKEFNLSPRNIRDILSRHTWKHV